MALYIIIATLIFLGTFIKDTKNKYFKFIFVLLFLFTALHDPRMGSDPVNYMRIFNYVYDFNSFLNNSYMFADYGIGIPFLMSITKTIYNDYYLFQVCYCLLSTVLLYRVLKKADMGSKEQYLTLFVYFCYRFFQNSMEFLRQGIAIELVWLSFLYYKDEEKVTLKQLILAIVGAMFHASAIIAVPTIILAKVISRRDFNARNIFAVTVTISILMKVLPTSLYSSALYRFLGMAGSNFARYADHMEVSGSGLNYINFAIRIAFLFIITFNFANITYSKKCTVFILGCAAVLVGSIDIGYITRLLEYYMIAIYIVAALSHSIFTKKSRNVYLIILYSVFMIILIRNLHTVGAGGYLNWRLYQFN